MNSGANVAFDWLLSATRKGYAGVRLGGVTAADSGGAD